MFRGSKAVTLSWVNDLIPRAITLCTMHKYKVLGWCALYIIDLYFKEKDWKKKTFLVLSS